MKKLLEELFKLYYQDIWRYLYSLCCDPALAEELASETFLEAVKAIATFRGRSEIKTWLFSIARHRWLAYLRKQGRTPVTEELTDMICDPTKGLEERLADKDTIKRFRELLEMEPERSKTVMKLRIEGFSYHEIGGMLGISENSARVIHFRVREKLKEKLRKEGYLDESY